MKVMVLGCNGPFPSAGGACSSYLITSGEIKILVDAGSGSFSNLLKCINPEELNGIILSHLHWDHMTDIPVLNYYLHVMKLQGKEIKSIDLYLPGTPVEMYKTISGFKTFIPHEITDNLKFGIGDINISFRRMTHPVESYAVRFETDGKSLVYSGDSTINADLPVFAAGCDLLIADSGFLDARLTANSPHMSAAQCAETAGRAGVKKLMLSHLDPFIGESAYLKEAKKVFSNSTTAVLMKEEEV